MSERERKQFMFTFEGGGWNTVWAVTKQEAIKLAMDKYKESEKLNPIAESFHETTERGLSGAMSSFY
jgi:hypothetical protein